MLGYSSFQESIYRAASVGDVKSLTKLALDAEKQLGQAIDILERVLLKTGPVVLTAAQHDQIATGSFKIERSREDVYVYSAGESINPPINTPT